MVVYFSFPMVMLNREAFYTGLSSELKEFFPEVHTFLWKPGISYRDSMVTDCDIFIFRPVENKWSFNIKELPSGVKKELLLARAEKKKIYLAYTTVVGQTNFYEVLFHGDLIVGVGGTSANIFSEIRKYADNIKKDFLREPGNNGKLVEEIKQKTFTGMLEENILRRLDSYSGKPISSFDPRLLLG